jgi:hypothetical protein
MYVGIQPTDDASFTDPVGFSQMASGRSVVSFSRDVM